MRYLASLLVVVQLATVGTPVVRAQLVAVEVPVCEHVGGGSDARLGGQEDCQRCDLPDCHLMRGCVMTTPAAMNEASFEFLLSFDLVQETDLTARRDDRERTPLLPPPRA